MGTVEIDYGMQTRLDLYMPRQAGRIVRPDEVIYICGDVVIAQDQLKMWQARHQETSDQIDLGNGKIGVKVYYSAKQDIDFEIQRNNRHDYLEREKKRGTERRRME
jgi:hypothetical protein